MLPVKDPREISGLFPTGDGLAEELAQLRPVLMRFARNSLRDKELAEEVVQDALMAGLEGLSRFNKKSSLKTWVTSILNNKIIDLRRKMASCRRHFEVGSPGVADDVFFDSEGNWLPDSQPADWGDPVQAFSDEQFWAAFEACLGRLSDVAAEAFILSELQGLKSREICEILGITLSNCDVLLHRGRMELRLCLDRRSFRVRKNNREV